MFVILKYIVRDCNQYDIILFNLALSLVLQFQIWCQNRIDIEKMGIEK